MVNWIQAEQQIVAGGFTPGIVVGNKLLNRNLRISFQVSTYRKV